MPLVLEPTPLHRLPRVSKDLGIDLWIKRDDLTGFAFGGNKGRKLEYLIPEALTQGADVVVTCGAAQSNFVRQLGAACAVAGLRCVAVCMHTPHDHSVGPSPQANPKGGGNLMLDEILGVEVRIVPDGSWDELFAATEDCAVVLERTGQRVYRIPIGGSSALGAYAFRQAAAEIPTDPPFDWLLFSSSSGSTQVGLCHGFRGLSTQVLGILADPEPQIGEDFAALSESLAHLTGDPPLAFGDFLLNLDFVGPGYGIPSPAGTDAIRYLARMEGVFLDPIYTAKAFAGLVALARAGEIGGRVLFWHTGGLPALLAFPVNEGS